MSSLVALIIAACSADAGTCGAGEYCQLKWNEATQDCASEGSCVAFPEVELLEFSLPIPSGESVFCAKGPQRPNGSHGTCSPTGRFAIDLATPSGEPPHLVLAAADGVAFAFGGCTTDDLDRGHSDRCNGGWGNVVHIEHAPGVFTLYAHLSSLLVASGTKVVRGQPIGVEGNTGAAGGKHIHFGLQRGEASQVGAGESVPLRALRISGATLSSEQLTCGDWAFDGRVHPETGVTSETALVRGASEQFLTPGPRVTNAEPPEPDRESSVQLTVTRAIAGVLLLALVIAMRRKR